jgi:hypothetical protein
MLRETDQEGRTRAPRSNHVDVFGDAHLIHRGIGQQQLDRGAAKESHLGTQLRSQAFGD